MGFGAGDVVGLIWSHPIASVVVALLFTPPLFPIVVFFSPLLISTALVVLAMISMGSDGEDNGATHGGYGHSHYKRDWHEHEETDQVNLDDDDGPFLIEEERRLSKRRKGVGSQQEDGWLEKVKSWEETGRAWVDSVLHQESRKPGSISSTEPLLSATREVRFARPIPQPLPTPPPPAAATPVATSPSAQESSPPLDSTENVQPPPAAAGDDQARGPLSATEISSVEHEEEMIEIPLHRNRGFPLPEPSKVVIEDSQSMDREDDLRPSVKWDEGLPTNGAGPEVMANGAKEQRNEAQSGAFTLPKEEVAAVADSKANSSGEKSSISESDRSAQIVGADQELTSSSTGEGKSASAEAAVMRERRGEHHRTPSVVVTLSEKLNVPLEDMMSLLAGDEKPPSSSSSKETGPKHYEGWSSSDDDVIRAGGKGEDAQSLEKST